MKMDMLQNDPPPKYIKGVPKGGEISFGTILMINSDFCADFLTKIWRKMNHHVSSENIPDKEKPIVVDRGKCRAAGRSTMAVEVAEE